MKKQPPIRFFTDPLLQVPGHKIHFTATGTGANVSFEAGRLGGDFLYKSCGLGGMGMIEAMTPNLGKSNNLAKLGQTKNERLLGCPWW